MSRAAGSDPSPSREVPRPPLHRLAVVALLLVALFAASCSSGGSSAPSTTKKSSEKPVTGGKITVAIDAPVRSFNTFVAAGRNPQTATVVAPVLSQLMIYTPEFTYEPQLLVGEPDVVSEDPLKLTYKLRPEAVWDDGSPVTAADVQATLDAVLAPANEVVSRSGYDKIVGGKLSAVSPDGKEFSLDFTEPYGAWRELFSSPYAPVLQASKTAGKPFGQFLNGELPFSSGPYKVASASEKDGVLLVRNDAYWGEKAYLDEVRFRPIESPTVMAQAIAGGEVNVATQFTRPDTAADFGKVPNTVTQVTPGTIWEHIDVNLRDAVVGVPEVRQAIFFALDREEVVDAVVRRVDPQAEVLQNAFFVPNQGDAYRPHFDQYRRDVNRSADLLQKAGYAKGPDGAFSKDGKKLTVTLLTTEGDALREGVAAILKRQLAEAGIELAVEAVPTTTLVDRVPNCEYQLAMFAYRGSPDPSWAAPLYLDDQISCPGPDQNPTGQNSTALRDVEVSELLRAAAVEVEERTRIRLYNNADRAVANAAPTLPLFQRATVLTSDRRIRNVIANPTVQGPAWNLGEWWLPER